MGAHALLDAGASFIVKRISQPYGKDLIWTALAKVLTLRELSGKRSKVSGRSKTLKSRLPYHRGSSLL